VNKTQLIGIAFDIDGVVADIMDPIRKKCEFYFGSPYRSDRETAYDLRPALGGGITQEECDEYVDWVTRQWYDIPINPGARKLTTAVIEHTGKAVPFVTFRHQRDVGADTYALLDSFMEVPYTVAFAGGTKHQICDKSLYIPSGYQFVEDRRAAALELASKGIFTWLIRTKYNLLDRTQKSSKVCVVNDLRDIYDFYF